METGTYTLAANWSLGASDSNEFWVSYSGQGKAVIDGASAYYVTSHGSTGLTVEGLTFQNLTSGANGEMVLISGTGYVFRWNIFNNCVYNCIVGENMANSVVDSNTFNGMTGANKPNDAGFNTAVGFFNFPVSGNTISHNLCENLAGGCAQFDFYGANGSNNNNTMSYNLAYNVLTNCYDCGAFYIYDPTGNSADTGNQIIYNADYSNGDPAGATVAIYLDDGVSNVLVKGNIIASYNGSTTTVPSTYAFDIHGGNNNTFEDNIVQIETLPAYKDYWGTTYAGNTVSELQADNTTNMAGNVFQNNIIFTSGGWPNNPLWDNNGSSQAPSITGNDFYSPSGNPSNFGFTVSNSVYLNPTFNSPTANNYAVGNAVLQSDISFPSLPTGQGPLAYPY